LDEPNATRYVYVYDDGTRTEQLLNYDPLQITVHARLLGRSTGSLELEMLLTFKNLASYIQDGRTTTLQMLHFMYFFNKYKY